MQDPDSKCDEAGESPLVMSDKMQQIIYDLRQLLVHRFHVANSGDGIPVDAPLFSSEVGLCSLDGLELLTELEDKFGVTLNDDLLFADAPTLRSLASHLANSI